MPDLSSFAPRDFVTLGFLLLSALSVVLFFLDEDWAGDMALGMVLPFAVLALLANLKL